MSRLAPPDPATLGARQQAIYDAVATGPRKGVRGPIAIWLHRPGLAEHAQALGQYCRYDSSLPPRLSELAILILGKYWQAEYEWVAHKPHALNAGLAPEVIEAVRTGARPNFTQADEELVYDFVTTLNRERDIPEALYGRAIAVLGSDGVVDLTGIVGYYTFISMTIKVFDLPLMPGQVPDLPPK